MINKAEPCNKEAEIPGLIARLSSLVETLSGRVENLGKAISPVCNASGRVPGSENPCTSTSAMGAEIEGILMRVDEVDKTVAHILSSVQL